MSTHSKYPSKNDVIAVLMLLALSPVNFTETVLVEASIFNCFVTKFLFGSASILSTLYTVSASKGVANGNLSSLEGVRR